MAHLDPFRDYLIYNYIYNIYILYYITLYYIIYYIIYYTYYILYVYIPTLSLFAIEMVMFLSCWEGAPPEDSQVSKPTGLS